MALIRVAWLLLTGFVFVIAVVGVLVALIPEYQYTSCEVIDGGSSCFESALSQNGYGIVAGLVLPVLLCLIPVVIPNRAAAWGVAATLLIGGLAVLFTIGSMGGAFLLISLLATLLAILHDRIARMRSAAVPPTP